MAERCDDEGGAVKLTITAIQSNQGETIATGAGTDEASNEVRFAPERRGMLAIAEATQHGEEPDAELPDWAIL